MSTETTDTKLVSRSYCERRKDPIRHADEILAVRIIRDPDTHQSEPLRVGLDQSAIDHTGWRAGDAIALEPVLPELGRSDCRPANHHRPTSSRMVQIESNHSSNSMGWN